MIFYLTTVSLGQPMIESKKAAEGVVVLRSFYKSELFSEFSTSRFTVWVGEQIPYINFEM